MNVQFRTPLLSLLMMLAVPTVGLPCGDCVLPSGDIKPVHPQSLQLAIAVRRELESGLLEEVNAKGFSSVWARLPQRDFLLGGFQLLVVEDGSTHSVEPVSIKHSRIQPVRIVTCRAVLQALADQRIHLETAVGRGLMVIEADSEQATLARNFGAQSKQRVDRPAGETSVPQN